MPPPWTINATGQALGVFDFAGGVRSALKETDTEERRHLVALGYLSDLEPERSELAAAVQAYFSDKLAAEKL